MVYFGISSTRSSEPTKAWQLKREFACRPQALSSISSSSSVASAKESKPVCTITWQVVHAQDFSQACSIFTPAPAAALMRLTPATLSNSMPSGQCSACGKILILAINLSLIDARIVDGVLQGIIPPSLALYYRANIRIESFAQPEAACKKSYFLFPARQQSAVYEIVNEHLRTTLGAKRAFLQRPWIICVNF